MSYSRRDVLRMAGAGTVLCLVFSWNDYAFASTFSGPDSQTLPIVVAPMIVLGLVVRRRLVTGLRLGAATGE